MVKKLKRYTRLENEVSLPPPFLCILPHPFPEAATVSDFLGGFVDSLYIYEPLYVCIVCSIVLLLSVFF